MNVFILSLFALFQSQNALIEGVVKEAATNAPINGVLVTLRPGLTATTDDTGRFRFSAPAGEYTLRARRDGYFGPVENGVPADAASRRIVVAAGRQLGNIAIDLHAGGAITGQLLDAGGRPRRGMPVMALRAGYDNGRRVFTPARMTETDDRGEFRLYWVPPGEFLVSALPQSSFVPQTPTPSQRLPARTFFPGTADLSKAISVAVQSRTEATGINFAIQTVQTVTVTGRVINPYATRPPEPAPGQPARFIAPPRIALASRGAAIDDALSSFGNGATAAESREGIFRFIGVSPGSYDLYVVAGDGGPTFRTVAAASVALEIGNQDVSGVTVSVRPPVGLKPHEQKGTPVTIQKSQTTMAPPITPIQPVR